MPTAVVLTACEASVWTAPASCVGGWRRSVMSRPPRWRPRSCRHTLDERAYILDAPGGRARPQLDWRGIAAGADTGPPASLADWDYCWDWGIGRHIAEYLAQADIAGGG